MDNKDSTSVSCKTNCWITGQVFLAVRVAATQYMRMMSSTTVHRKLFSDLRGFVEGRSWWVGYPTNTHGVSPLPAGGSHVFFLLEMQVYVLQFGAAKWMVRVSCLPKTLEDLNQIGLKISKLHQITLKLACSKPPPSEKRYSLSFPFPWGLSKVFASKPKQR